MECCNWSQSLGESETTFLVEAKALSSHLRPNTNGLPFGDMRRERTADLQFGKDARAISKLLIDRTDFY